MNPNKQKIDEFALQLLRSYASDNRENDRISPFFMTRLQARICEERQIPQLWEMGIIKAQRWLVALSVVALIFFFGNLFALGTQIRFPVLSAYSVSDSYESDDLQVVSEEALTMEGFQKE